ncbi:MAG TPA: NfeD family protein [Erysipelothrix sp.]|nr:NfeD family protein [Erysipelothrix sp.]
MIIALFIGVFLGVSAAFIKPNLLFMVLSFVAFGFYFNIPQPNFLIYALFIFSVILLIIEFYIPGFGISGILGITGSLSAFYLSGLSIVDSVILSLLLFGLALATLFMYLKLGYKLNLSPGLILNTNKESQYASRDISPLINKRGVTQTPLRPVGKVMIDDEVYEAYSGEDMIASQQEVIVHKIENNKIYVRREKL